MNLCDIIYEAGVCAGKLAAKWVDVATYGNKNDKLYYDWLRLECYIRTLERNQTIIKTIKAPISLEGQFVDFSSLKKQNNVLLLDSKEEFTCTTVEISPCLSDSEICKIIEQVKLLCSNCNCNCN